MMRTSCTTTATALGRLCFILCLPLTVSAFLSTQTPHVDSSIAFAPRQSVTPYKNHLDDATLFRQKILLLPTTLRASTTESGFELKRPTSQEATELGARDWPQQVKMGSWTERFDAGQLAARYVLEGAGMVQVTLYDNDDGFTPKTELPEGYRLVPGSLVEAMGPCRLDWQTDEDMEMVILTPGYEQGSLLAAVGALFVVICGALIAGVGQ